MKKLATIIMALMLGCMLAGQAAAVQTVEGDITANTTWSQDVLLRGPVFVRAGATLTINAGVTVFGEKATLGTLIIDRGAKLNAIGTEEKPIVYTSDQPVNARARADNGGLIINGYSTLNVQGGTKEGEGDTGTFGCSGADCNENDNSGTLRYFRVEYGGIQFSPDNELNGIAFQGVGRGTTVDHVQIDYSKDDCMEFFGGTVNVKNIILTACGDDSLDWTDGWRGNGQFIVAQQLGDEADNGIEADNLDKANDSEPRSNPTLYNMTFVGDPDFGEGSTNGMLLRRGTAGNIRNSIVMGFKKSGVNIDSLATFTQAQEGNLIVDNNIFWNNNPNFNTDETDPDVAQLPFTTEQFMKTMMQNNKEVDPKLGSAYDVQKPDFRPAAGSPAVDGTVPVAAPPTGNSFIVATNYIGAVDPANDWTRKSWTTYGVRETPTTTTTVPANTTTTTIPTTTTTTPASPCPATQVLGAQSRELDTLRAFRDNVMGQSLKGMLYTRLYYYNAGEVNSIINADESLKMDAAAALDTLLPAVEAAISSGVITLSDQQKAEILPVLDRISSRASFGLRLIIRKVQRDLRAGDML
jgi:hypothetical protein